MAHEGHIPRVGSAPAQIPAVPGGAPEAQPELQHLEAAGHPLPPVDGHGDIPPMAGVPAALNFSEPGLIEIFDRLAHFALSPLDAPRAAPAPAPRAPAAPPPIEDPRLAATTTFCQQLVGNHAAIQHFLNPGSGFNVIDKAMALDTERRVLVIDSLVDIVRFGRRGDEAAAANIVDQIQQLAMTYLDNAATEEQLDAADRILPRLVQRVMECDAASNNNPLWLRLVAIANLFGRTVRGQAPSPSRIEAQRLHRSAAATLPSDAAFRAALQQYTPDDPARTPLARVIGSDLAAANPKGKFRKIAYAPRGVVLARETLPAIAAEYPDVLYTISNAQRSHYDAASSLEPLTITQIYFRDRYILSDPSALQKVLNCLPSWILSPIEGSDIWALFKSKVKNLRNSPNPEIRRMTEECIRRIALAAKTGPALNADIDDIAAEAEALLTVGGQILLTAENFFITNPCELMPGLWSRTERAQIVANYVTGAPGFVVGGFLGLVGGAVFGFFKGLAKGQNPLKTAALTAKSAAIHGAFYGSFLLGGFVGSLLVETPVLAARATPHPADMGFTYLLGLPGTFLGGLIGGIGGGIVGFFAGLFTGHNPLKYAQNGILGGSGGGAIIGTYLFGGFIGAGLDLLVHTADLALIRLTDASGVQIPRRLFDFHSGSAQGGTLGSIATGLPGGIVCGLGGAIIGGIGGFVVGLFQGRNPFVAAAEGAGKLASYGAIYGGFALGGFIGYLPGRLLGWFIEKMTPEE